MQSEKMQWKVLAILRHSEKPLSAYDIMGELREFNPKIAPQTVYRALAALANAGQVHRLEALNAYVACRHEHHANACILSFCDDCGIVEESAAAEVFATLSAAVRQTGFSPRRHVIEVYGVCQPCESRRR